MHIVRGLYDRAGKKRKSKMTKKKAAELAEYNKYRESIGMEPLTSFVTPSSKTSVKHTVSFGTYKPPAPYRREGSLDFKSIKSLPDSGGIATVQSIMDPRNLAKESPEIREAILAKSQRIAPAYNKGAAQYITDGADLTDIGRKK